MLIAAAINKEEETIANFDDTSIITIFCLEEGNITYRKNVIIRQMEDAHLMLKECAARLFLCQNIAEEAKNIIIRTGIAVQDKLTGRADSYLANTPMDELEKLCAPERKAPADENRPAGRQNPAAIKKLLSRDRARVYEFSKALNVPVPKVINALQEMDIFVRGASATIKGKDVIEKVVAIFKQEDIE